MILGLLPAIRGGLGELARTGQHSRLIDGYLKPYGRAFAEVRYFSYLDETLERYTDDPEVLARVRLLPGGRLHPWLYAFVLPLRYQRALRGCAVLRVFQVTGVVPALVAKRLWGVPFVTTYGFWYERLARSRASALLRRAVAAAGLAVADAVIVTTEELGAHVASRIDPARVQLIPNGVDTSLFRPTPPPSGPVRNVLFIGRLSAEKDLGTLVEAAGRLAGRLPLRLTFVGEGPARPALADDARRRAVAAEFVPFVDHRDLPRFLAAADAFVLPSRTEGHPKVLLEAMSAGRPCLASAVGGNRAILADGDTGLLFAPGDAAALADRLERVLADEALARRLGEQARAEVVKRYDLAALVEQEVALLRRVAGGA